MWLQVLKNTKCSLITIQNSEIFSNLHGFENMLPYFIPERIINPEELIEDKPIRVESFLAKIAKHLKDGHLYSLLKIMKCYGKLPDKELAYDMEKKLSLI